MKILLDSQIFLWMFLMPSRISKMLSFHKVLFDRILITH